MSQLIFHPLFSLFPLFILFFISMAAIAAEANNTHPNCPSYLCSNLNISYPFHKLGAAPANQFCGYQAFGINCSIINGSELPIFYIGLESYFVRSISYEPVSIILVDYDISPVVTGPINSNFCPRVQHGINITTLPFDFSPLTVNLSFHYNCTDTQRFPDFATEIQCLDFGQDNKSSCVNIETSDTENFNWGDYSCEDHVVTTVFRDQINGPLSLSGEYGRALSRGFELGWRRSEIEDCDMCEENKGRCGHHNVTGFLCFCYDGTTSKDHCKGDGGTDSRLMILVSVLGVLGVLSVTILVSIKFCLKRDFGWLKINKYNVNAEMFLKNHDFLAPKRYTYSQVRKMTNSFEIKVGQGGFGSVYIGKLSNQDLIAVKVLSRLKGNGEDFINEVASVGRTCHVNIVSLVGFCLEGHHRVLIYEFMPNGSLERFIYGRSSSNCSQLGWEKLLQIAIGIAKGLEYLHSGCNTRILHFDIKPHNILLDQDFRPKISDFGLAKLFPEKASMISMSNMRGTPGYIAPEIFSRSFGAVSHKSDVYSYGMMILEMVGGRRNVEVEVDHTSEIYFPHWIYKKVELHEDQLGLHGIINESENDMARKMIIVGLWCIQTNPINRPTITRVLEMLEGGLELLEIPPKPYMSSPSRSLNVLATDDLHPCSSTTENL